MKKLILLSLVVTLFSCKKNTFTKVDNKTERTIKGDWEITAVNHSKSIKVTSFNIADSKCFVGSKWKFISSNNTGNMSLSSSGCPSFESKITFYVNKDGSLVLKVLNGMKGKKLDAGYILQTSVQSEESFQLIDNVGGESIVYQFQKITKK